uniref:Uncharacterized protein n=1 Tax=Poecilia reticulata TaxID=8081 RepID=A0A3P9P5I9_POERE
VVSSNEQKKEGSKCTCWFHRYVTGDLFFCSWDESLAHSGIVVMFKKKFGRVSKLKEHIKYIFLI